MKESIEDMIAKRIKEVMEQYNPDYSPQAWDNLRKQIPVSEFWLRKLLRKYKFSLSVVTILGVLIIGYELTSLLLTDKKSFADHEVSGSANYYAKSTPEEMIYPQYINALKHSNSDPGISSEEKNISSGVTSVRITDFVPSVNEDPTPTIKAIAMMANMPVTNCTIPDLPEVADFGNKNNIPKLVPIRYQVADIHLSKNKKNKVNDNPHKLRFILPDFSSLFTKQEGYNRFVGPDELFIFYSPEIHHSDSLNTLGISQGVGISFEGKIRSSISISVGLSYQSMNFSKTILLGKVPPHITGLQPADTNRTFYYIDSIGIRSGSYKFLELPVAIKFKVLESDRSDVWLGAGISSISFLRQDYTYETVEEGVSESSRVSVKAWENIYPLASFNLSLLYRHEFSNRLILHSSVQYKQHLVPMGYNSMKLNRLNFQVGIIYRFRIKG